MSWIQFIKSKTFVKHLILSSVVAGGVLWLSFMFLGFLTEHGQYIKIPSFKGVYVSDIDEFIADYPLEYEITDSIYNLKEPKGIVLEQDPAPDSEVKRGRKVYLTVNAILNQQVPMPNLIDLSERQAVSLLQTYGLEIGNKYYVPGLPPVLDQKFKGQTIKPGTLIDKGSSIDLVLGSNAKSSNLIIPSLVGLNFEEAKEVANENGYQLNYDFESLNASDSTTFIISDQNPAAGSDQATAIDKQIKIRFIGQDSN